SDADAYREYQMELSWPNSGLDFMGVTMPASASPLQTCQSSPYNDTSGTTEFLQDYCTLGHGTTTYTGQFETVDIRCAALGTFVIHLVPLSEDPNFGSTLLAPNAASLPTGTADATIVCTDATSTPAPTSTPCPSLCPTPTSVVTT